MASFSLTNVSNLFKIKYGKISENAYNSANVVLGRCKKSYDFTGRQMFVPVPQSFAGGVGSGTLPTANYTTVEDAIITAKKMYSVVQIDRESIKASADNEGAFVQATKWVVQRGVESWMRNMSRTLFNDGTGILGQHSGNFGGSAAAPTATILTTGSYPFKEANFEERDYVNVNSLASVFEITAVNPTTRVITMSRISGSDDLTAIGAGTHSLYMQNSKDLDPSGISGVVKATSGTQYTITVGRRWQASSQIDASSAGLTTDLMNQAMLEVEQRSGKCPNLIVCGYTQYRKLLNLLEDQKQYVLEPRSSDLKGKVSFKGVEFMSSQGPVGVFPERFCEADEMYFLNDEFISIHHRPDFGWFDDDGTIFLRDAGDTYSARYGGYLETFVNPVFQGIIQNLAT